MDDLWDDDEPVIPPDLTVEVTDPEPVGFLYGPDGECFAVYPDRPAFGFTSNVR